MRALPILLPLLLLTACTTTASPASPPVTAIYSPPTRLGGTGSMMFLPGTAAPRGAGEAIAVIVALHRRLDRDGVMGCLNPVLAEPDVSGHEREDAVARLKEAGQRRPGKAAIRADIVDDVRESWGGVGNGPDFDPLPPPVATALLDAYADAVMVAPRKGRATLLTQAMLPDDIRLRSDCGARLSRPTISGDWAFVGSISATAGHLWALRREATGWTLVAHRFTAIA